MGGFFAVASRDDCVSDLFYGTDYHSHLGTRRGGLATLNDSGFTRFIHNIENAQFRSKFEDDISKAGVACQPKLGSMAIRAKVGTPGGAGLVPRSRRRRRLRS